MSHFKFEVIVPVGKVERFLEATLGPWEVGLKEVVDNGKSEPAVPAGKTKRGKKKGSQRGTPDTKLTMTGKMPLIGNGLLARGLTVFEILEKNQGIGAVTVTAFREELTKQRMKYQLQTRLLHEGYMDYLD